MKAPWEIFTDLLSKKRRTTQAEPDHGAVGQFLHERQDDPVQKHSSPSAKPGQQAEDPFPRIDLGADDYQAVDTATEDLEEMPSGASAESAAPVPQPDMLDEVVAAPDEELVPSGSDHDGKARPTPTKRKARSTRRRIKTSLADGVSAHNAEPNIAPSPDRSKKTALEVMAELDNEIDQLRVELAEKLLVQNEQLRQMIGRYDRMR